MNEFIDALLKVIAIVFLLVITLFVFSLLIEYARFLWARHKTKKQIMRAFKHNKELDKLIESEAAPEDIVGALEKTLKENGMDGFTIDEVEKITVKKDKKNKKSE